MEKEQEVGGCPNGRRDFLRKSLVAGGALAVGAIGIQKMLSQTGYQNPDHATATPDTLLYTTDGKVYKANTRQLEAFKVQPVSNEEARKGIPGKKFVMVIDLAKCDGCKKCTEACQSMHFTDSDREWIKVYKMKGAEAEAPYFFPKPCFHCDNPPCTKVCPVGATFKRQDGIVLIDN